MNKSNLLTSIDISNTVISFTLFIFLVFAIPFISVLIISFGPSEWSQKYIPLALSYKPALIFISGLFTGYLAKESPIISSLIVGILGGVIILALLSFSTTTQNQELPISTFAWQGFITIALCTAGGSCVSLLRRNKKALTSSSSGTNNP